MKEKAKSEELGEKPKIEISAPVLKPEKLPSSVPLSKQSTQFAENSHPKKTLDTPEENEREFEFAHFNKLQKATSEVMIRDHQHKSRLFPTIAVSKTNDEFIPVKLKKFGPTGLIEVIEFSNKFFTSLGEI